MPALVAAWRSRVPPNFRTLDLHEHPVQKPSPRRRRSGEETALQVEEVVGQYLKASLIDDDGSNYEYGLDGRIGCWQHARAACLVDIADLHLWHPKTTTATEVAVGPAAQPEAGSAISRF